MDILLPGIYAALATCLAGFLFRAIGIRYNLRSDPRRQRYYSESRPLFGGLAVAIGFWVGILIFYVSKNGQFSDAYFSDETVRGMLATLWWATIFLVLPTSLADRRQEGGYYKWLYVLASAAFIAANHFFISDLSIPLIGVWSPSFWPGLLVTILWIIMVVSIVEVLESIGGVVTLAPILLFSLFFFFGSPPEEIVQRGVAACFVGSVLGIFPCQRIRDGIVLGKAGNKVVGFLFAALTLLGRRKASTAEFLILPIGILVFYLVTHSLARFEKRIRTE